MSDATPQYSRQPRFNEREVNDFFSGMAHFVKDLDMEAPAYATDSRKRDKWLRRLVQRESYLNGVVSAVMSIDKNRGWRMVGGRNQVLRFTEMMHNFYAAPGIYGWRPAISMSSQSFWSSDIGAVVELGRDGRNGPLRSLYTVDPTCCKLTGDTRKPLKYLPAKSGKMQDWRPEDFFRVASMPSTEESFNGLGYCAVSRSAELVSLMLALYEHEMEKMGFRAPRGLLLLSGITQAQWDSAMAARDANLEGREADYFGAVAVLANASNAVDGKLVALSELPTSFNKREWMDMVLYGIALCFGYDPSEFWPVQFGAIGRGTETELQAEKATGKGKLDFVLGFQEQLQHFLPDTLEFAFDQRDDRGDLMRAEVHAAWANIAKTLYTAFNTYEGPLLGKDQTLFLLAENGIIPRSWAPTDEIEATAEVPPDDDPAIDGPEAPQNPPPDATNTPKVAPTGPNEPSAPQRTTQLPVETLGPKRLKLLREELRSRATLERAARQYPTEPIVEYFYPEDTLLTLWDAGAEVLKPNLWKGV